MASDVERLLLQVDASVELAKRNLRDLSKEVAAQTGNWEKSLDKSDASFKRMGQSLNSVGQYKQGMQQLGYQIGDVATQMASGTKASIIFAQQSGQVIQAIQLMAGETSGFLKFLGGPWGIALSTAAIIISSFAGKLFETGSEVDKLVDKMRKQAQQARDQEAANKIWERSIEGVTEAIREQTKAQEKLTQTPRSELVEQRDTAQKRGTDAFLLMSKLVKSQGELTVAAERAQRQVDALSGGLMTEASASALSAAQLKLAGLQARLKNVGLLIAQQKANMKEAATNVRGLDAQLGKLDVEAAFDPATKAAQALEQAEADLLAQRRAGTISQEQYNAKLRDAKQAYKDATDEAKKATKAVGEFGKQVSFDEAASIARSAGFTVNSAQRSTERQRELYNDPKVNRPGNPVAVPGTSAHEGANGKWALDIQITADVTPDKIRKAFASQGVRLTKVFKEAGHYHVEGSRSEAARAENIAQREADRAAERKQEQDQNFAGQSERLNAQMLDAQMELVTGIQAQADFAGKQLDAEQQRYETQLKADVEDHRLTDKQAELLVERSRQVTAVRKANLEQRTKLRLLEDQNRTLQQESEFKIEGLRYADEIARTQDAHRKIQLEIIDALYKQREADLKLAKAKALAAQEYGEADRIQGQIDQLPIQQGRDVARAERGTMSPLEAWMDGVPKSAAEMNEAYQAIAVGGLDALADGLAGVISGTQSLGDVFKSVAQQIIADIARMMIRMMIMRAMMSMFGGGGGLGVTDAGATLSTTSLMPSGLNLGGLLSLLPSLGAANGGLFQIGGRGGVDTNVVSINGRPSLRVSAGETMAIIPAERRARLGNRTGDAGADLGMTASGDTFYFNLTTPNTGNARRDRRTSMQHAQRIQDRITRARRKGLAA